MLNPCSTLKFQVLINMLILLYVISECWCILVFLILCLIDLYLPSVSLMLSLFKHEG